MFLGRAELFADVLLVLRLATRDRAEVREQAEDLCLLAKPLGIIRREVVTRVDASDDVAHRRRVEVVAEQVGPHRIRVVGGPGARTEVELNCRAGPRLGLGAARFELDEWGTRVDLHIGRHEH